MSGIISVILVIHVLVALSMIGVILLQRSEGGALGIGGGSGSFLSARGAGNVLTRATTILVVVFFLTSMALTILSRHSGPKTLNLGGTPATTETSAPQPVAPQPAETPDSEPAKKSMLPQLPGFETPATPETGSAQPATMPDVKPPAGGEALPKLPSLPDSAPPAESPAKSP